MNIALSSNDISSSLGGRTIILKYYDLGNITSIEQLLSLYGNAIVLYPLKGNIGHWTTVFYTKGPNGKKVIEFFDPYGISVDREFKYVKANGPNYMSQLLYRSRYQIVYNEHKFQKFGDGIDTCGRWVLARLAMKDMSLEEFAKYIFSTSKKYNISTDELVTQITTD